MRSIEYAEGFERGRGGGFGTFFWRWGFGFIYGDGILVLRFLSQERFSN